MSTRRMPRKSSKSAHTFRHLEGSRVRAFIGADSRINPVNCFSRTSCGGAHSKSDQFDEKAESYSIKDWCPFTQAPDNLLLQRLHRRPAGRTSCRFAFEISVQQRATKDAFSWMEPISALTMADLRVGQWLPRSAITPNHSMIAIRRARQIAIALLALAQEHDQDNEGNRDSN